MTRIKRTSLLSLLIQLLALSPFTAGIFEEPCCILDKRFGEFCPTTCGVAEFYQEFQNTVNKELQGIENGLNIIHNVSTLTKNKINDIVQTNTIVKKQSPDIYIQKLTEIQSEILVYEKSSRETDVEILDLENIVSMNNEKIKQLKILAQQLHDRCGAPCQDTVRINKVTGRDCQDIADQGERTSGLYYVKPLRARRQFLVYCDIDETGRGWTVLQRRVDGSVDFARNWIPYKEGFGYLSPDDSTEYWLGNEKIHLLTTQSGGPYLLEVVLKDWSNERRTAQYMDFKVGSEEDKYRLRYSYFEGGDAGNAFEGYNFDGDPSSVFLTAHNGMQFSTPDVDNDKYDDANCAEQDQSGWWMNRCHAANLNGKYYQGGAYTADETTSGYDNGIIWATWHSRWYSFKETTMKIIPYKKYVQMRSQVEQGQFTRGDSA